MKYAEISNKFRKFFELPTFPVAVKIVQGETSEKADEMKPLRYCEMIRNSAVYGDTYTFDVNCLSCASGELALGFTEPAYGEVYPRIKPATTSLIKIAPLEKAGFEPDVVIVVGNPRRIMRMITVLSQLEHREPVAVKFKGEFAVCGECTAIPLMEHTTNISLLCSGSRMFAGYRDDEITIGFPFEKFKRLAEATEEEEITKALCGCIMDDLPEHVVNLVEKLGFGKATDHFFGRFEREIIRLYTPKDNEGRITTLTLHVPIKYSDTESARKAEKLAEELLQKPVLHRVRDNWLDVAITVELEENLNRAAMRREKFESLLTGGIDAMLELVARVKRKTSGMADE
jgi:uncharacterized protein (DUF169 family)